MVRKRWMWPGIVMLFMVTLACEALMPGSEPRRPTAPPPLVEEEVADTPQPTPTMAVATPEPTATTLPPTPTVAPPTATPVPDPSADCAGVAVDFEGVSFCYDPALATGVGRSLLPAESVEVTFAESWQMPQRWHFEFAGYPTGDEAREVRMDLYPVAPLAQDNPGAAALLDEVREVVQGRPAPEGLDYIPVLPPVHAGQLIRAHVDYLELQNGQGVGFLTQYAQDTAPIVNESLLYVVQGFIADEQVFVSAWFPVTHPNLRAAWDDYTLEELDALMADYGGYIEGMVAELNAQPPASFTPDLTLLQALVQSLRVEAQGP